MKSMGMVTLAGAGPGDPGLLTLKAAEAIATAEVLVYDRLVSPEILSMAPAGAMRINVGKQPKSHPVPQDEINALLVKLARAGRNVVRLKGGDPFIFGRGSEEAMELRRHGIPFTVIPGITSAQGAAVSTGVPLTHRGLATGVRYLTGHCRGDIALDFDWHGLADARTTLVIYMGLASIGEIVSGLMIAGRSPATPVLAVNNATTGRERRVRSTLGGLSADLEGIDFDGPVLFIAGEVVSLYGVLESEGASGDEAAVAALAR